MKKNAGFTLIEVIVVLVLVGIISSIAGFGIVKAVEGYLFTKNNMTTTQKAQLALARITRELAELSSLDAVNSSATAIYFSSPTSPPGGSKLGLDGVNVTKIKLAEGATPLTAGNTLTDSLYETEGFRIKYYNKDGGELSVGSINDPKLLARIEIRLRLARQDVALGYLEFTTSVNPRNTGNKNAPTG